MNEFNNIKFPKIIHERKYNEVIIPYFPAQL